MCRDHNKDSVGTQHQGTLHTAFPHLSAVWTLCDCIGAVIPGAYSPVRYLGIYLTTFSPGYVNDYRFKMCGACSPRWQIESYSTSTVPGYSDHTMIEIAMHLDINFTFRTNQKRSQKVKKSNFCLGKEAYP